MNNIDPAEKLEEQRWEAAESAMHEEVNRTTQEHRAEIEAREAHERLVKMARKKARIRREGGKLFLCRITLDAMMTTLFVSWYMTGFVPAPVAIGSGVLSVFGLVLDFNSYIAFARRWK